MKMEMSFKSTFSREWFITVSEATIEAMIYWSIQTVIIEA